MRLTWKFVPATTGALVTANQFVVVKSVFRWSVKPNEFVGHVSINVPGVTGTIFNSGDNGTNTATSARFERTVNV
mgnify:CR=1 FL=1